MAYKKYDPNSKNAIDGARGERAFVKWFSFFELPVTLVKTRPLIMAWLDLPEDHVRVSTIESQVGDYVVVRDGRVVDRIEVSSSDRDTKYVTLGDTKLENFDGQIHALVDLRRKTICLVHWKTVRRYVSEQTHEGYKLMPTEPLNQIDPRERFG